MSTLNQQQSEIQQKDSNNNDDSSAITIKTHCFKGLDSSEDVFCLVSTPSPKIAKPSSPITVFISSSPSINSAPSNLGTLTFALPKLSSSSSNHNNTQSKQQQKQQELQSSTIDSSLSSTSSSLQQHPKQQQLNESQILSTNLIISESSLDFANRIASILAQKLNRPCFVSSDISPSYSIVPLTKQIVQFITSEYDNDN